jgi:plasmid stability protein
MSATVTLKNIPDALYERLKMAAQAHRRSINSEVIVCLETVLSPSTVTPAERAARAQRLRAGVGEARFSAAEIDALKRAGRP